MKIDDKYKWLARDENGRLWVFEEKSFKRELYRTKNIWDIIKNSKTEIDLIEETDSTYSFIKWEDEQPVSIEYAKEIIETVDKIHFGKTPKELLKTRQVIVNFFDSQEYRTELTEDAARELIEFLEANKK